MPRKTRGRSKRKTKRSRRTGKRKYGSKSKAKKKYVKEPKVRLRSIEDFSKCSKERLSEIINQLNENTPESLLKKIAKDLGIPIGGLTPKQLLKKIHKYELQYSTKKKLSF